MAVKTKVKFNGKKLQEALMKKAVKVQTQRLIDYAMSEVTKMGDALIVSANGKPSDRTHNMINSLVWAVYYNGKMSKKGFYRKSSSTKGESSLHELGKPESVPVNGRQLAKEFLNTYRPNETQGWEIVWAVLAPYYAYWEEGHQNVFLSKFVKFDMMTQRYDAIKSVLGNKCKVSISVNVPKY